MAEKIMEHRYSGKNAEFKVLFTSGENSWMPYEQVSHLVILEQYLEAMGAENINALGLPNTKTL